LASLRLLPSGEEHLSLVASLTVALGIVALLRKERGALGAAAGVVALGATGFLLFMAAFPYACSWMLNAFMPN
jgi:hypothetical protein